MDDWDWDDKNRNDFPVATANLVTDQQDYTFPSNLLKIKRVEVSYDGTNWVRAEALDINESSNALANQTQVNNNFSTSTPFYDAEYNSLKLYPVPTSNVTNGIKIWYTREADEFTSAQVTTGTKEPGIDEPFHIMIALGVCWDFFVAKNLDSRAATTKLELDDYEARIRRHYGTKNLDRVWQLKPTTPDYQ